MGGGNISDSPFGVNQKYMPLILPAGDVEFPNGPWFGGMRGDAKTETFMSCVCLNELK